MNMSLSSGSKVLELNNNNTRELFEYKRNRNASVVSVSSGASSCHSDDSCEERASSPKILQGIDEKNNEFEKSEVLRLRSNSDGATHQKFGINNNEEEPFEVFPSLPDSVLQKMGLLGPGPRERLNEEEIEQKFVALALAFSIDSTTITDRCERQRRYRNQTEKNLAVEIERLIEKANRIQPLCVDSETTELLSTLLTQIDVVMSAALHSTIASERYGAAQHELRISESVAVMINHVNLLKQQRDSARRQLQYTKKVLQNTNAASPAPKSQNQLNSRLITKRRASIATITQPTTSVSSDNRRITRRISDLSLRASSMARNSRVGRLELGLDLVKIKEGMVEEPVPMDDDYDDNVGDDESPNQSEVEFNHTDDVPTITETSQIADLDVNKSPLPQRLRNKVQLWMRNVDGIFHHSINNRTLNQICTCCAIICFFISVICLANIFVEIQVSKREFDVSNLFWFWKV